ncbi:hypothetical protein D0Y60_24530, partial [Shinella sp. WSJ-2]|uniref:FG-GAP-like repeat-containing protein n=1 Tax=Shinella sp. WSJ-2 TaxID=2303749 RepID=UPI000E89A996
MAINNAGLDSNGRPTFTYTVVEGDGDTGNLAIAGIDSTDGSIDGLTELNFATPISAVSGNGIHSEIAAIDVNGDGKLDLLTANEFMSTVSILLGDGTGNFSSPTQVPFGSGAYGLFGFSTGDINGDGKLDLLAINISDNSVSVRLGDGAGHFSSGADVSVGSNDFTMALGDVNGDGKLDMVTGGAGVTLWLGDGAGGFSDPTSVLSSGFGAVLADVNRDGKIDLLASTGTSIVVRLGDGAGSFSGSGSVSMGSNLPSYFTVVDLNGDGKVDLLSQHNSSNLVSVRLGNGAGGFSGTTQLTFADRVSDIAVGDMNGDGKVDVVAANGGNVSVRLGDGAGNFSGSTDISVATSIDVVNLADVNRDGKLDILASYNGTTWVLLNTSQRSASFDDATITTADGVQTGRGVDATRPDAPDLALTHDNGSSSTDFLTNDGSLTVGKETGATLSYVVDGGEASATYDPTALAEGEHTVEVRQADAAGNISATSTITFTLDRTAPPAPTVVLSHDTGTSSTDGVTNDGSLTITGLEDGATLSYVVNDGEASATYDPSTFDDGHYTVKVFQTDTAGNVSLAGTVSFTYDLTIGPPEPYLANDTGSASNDFVTNDATLSIAGVEDGATLSYIIDGGPATATYDPTTLSDGEHTIKMKQTDAAGNVSFFYGTITFTLDRSKPNAVGLALASDTGKSATDKITSNGALTISGRESGATLSYIVDGGTASTTYDPSALANGTHTVKVIQTDVAGNVSSAGSLTFTLDKVAPTVAGVTTS